VVKAIHDCMREHLGLYDIASSLP